MLVYQMAKMSFNVSCRSLDNMLQPLIQSSIMEIINKKVMDDP